MWTSGIRPFPFFVALAGVLVSCGVGTQFVRPPADFVRLGETTRAQVVERYGKPQDERKISENGRRVFTVGYFFASESEAAKVPGALCVRTLMFTLSENVVVGEGLRSSCLSDHTDFDETKIANVVKGKTRCDEVIERFGRPSAREIYPSIEKKGDTGVYYIFAYMSLRAGEKPKEFKKEFLVMCDPAGVVSDTSYTESGTR